MGVSENMVEVGVARAEARVARAVCTHDAIAFCGNKAAATRAVLSQDRARFVQDAGHFKTAFHSQTALIYLFTVFRFSVVVVPITAIVAIVIPDAVGTATTPARLRRAANPGTPPSPSRRALFQRRAASKK